MSKVIIHGDEWKHQDVAEPIDWAKTNKWEKQTWKSDSENWDHDHCQICWWKLYLSKDPAHGAGSLNQENDNWVCTECYEQFLSKT